MLLQVIQALAVWFASKTSIGITIKELVPPVSDQCRAKVSRTTHHLQGRQSLARTLAVCIFWEAQMVSGNSVREIRVGLSAERSAPENQLVRANAQ